MSLNFNGVKAGGKRVLTPARGAMAPAWIEGLEARRLLSVSILVGHPLAAGNVPSAPIALRADFHAARVCGATPDAIAVSQATPISLNSSASVFLATAADKPIERLGLGGHFAGFDHPPLPGAPGSNGNTAPPASAPGNLSDDPAPAGQDVGQLNQPKSLKPAIEGHGNSTVENHDAPTPLALTPSAPASSSFPSSSAVSFVNPASIGPSSGVTAPDASIAPPHAHLMFGTIAMAAPANAVFAGGATAQFAVSVADASNKAADTLALIASADSVRGVVAYNFIHFNPAAMLNDAIASFTNESASLPPAAVSAVSTGRAWAITAAVVGVDLLFVGYWYQKTKRENTARLKRMRLVGWMPEMDSCPERLM